MSARSRWSIIVWKWLIPAVGLAALASAAVIYYSPPWQRHRRLTCTAGHALDVRHQLAIRLKQEAALLNVSLDLVPSDGSEEALDWVNSRKVDIAFVQGALPPQSWPNVRQVATLQLEPMHLLVKKELLREASVSLTALHGKTVDLGEAGSGSHSLAVAILEFGGLQPRAREGDRGYVPVSRSPEQLLVETNDARLPDAVFLVSSLPSPTCLALVRKHGYRLVPLPFAEAFALSVLAKSADAAGRISEHGNLVLGRVQAATVPAFTYGLEPAVPEVPLPTLGTRLLVVAHKDVAEKAVYSLIEATYDSEMAQIQQPVLDPKLMDLPPEFPWHTGADLYQRRNAPLLSGVAMDSLHKGFAILAAVASGLFVLWQWARLRGQLARHQEFAAYIAGVSRIEERGEAIERQRLPALPELLALRDQLNQLKTQALREFTDNPIAAKELLPGFLVLINDVRDNLTRLIRLHESAGEDPGQVPVESR